MNVVRRLNEDLLLHTLELTTLPLSSVALQDHLSTCSDLPCPLVREFHANVRALRLVNKRFNRYLTSFETALTCIHVTDNRTFNSSRYPDLLQKLSRTLSLDVHVSELSDSLLRDLSSLVHVTPALRRLSLKGGRPRGKYSLLEADFFRFVVELRSSSKMLRSVLLDAPLDALHILRGLRGVRVVQTHCITVHRGLDPSSWWRGLTDIKLKLSGYGHTFTNAAAVLAKDELSSLRSAHLVVANGVSDVNTFLLSVKDTLVDLSLFFDGGANGVRPLPEGLKIAKLACNISTAHRLVVHPIDTLREVSLHRVSYHASHMWALTRDLDLFLWDAVQGSRLSQLTQVRLVPFQHSLSAEVKWDLSDIGVLCYWAKVLDEEKIAFIDATGGPVFSKGLTSVQRTPPV